MPHPYVDPFGVQELAPAYSTACCLTPEFQQPDVPAQQANGEAASALRFRPVPCGRHHIASRAAGLRLRQYLAQIYQRTGEESGFV